ncbi:type IV pilus assembly protein PilV [Pseudoxanthomonas sp. GM95]|uniref:type IV pilus modification protein PilV n=1 Tax=Pseudoxanthomonas sp. GM95 TaxID=1881043 RepID=UPI0008D79BED|nr:type IV pilus modification protein PilV [Pseudoxanthomonas sp. GM95]SEK68737.1 type IV pilus assembly protein PilV [Pseudoxanthomonas sp. GM95]
MKRAVNITIRSSQGFTLIEVLIALVVLAFGLLGFAMLQAMNVRFVESANYRTQATNLGYEIMDQVRANKVSVSSYVGTYTATTSGCAAVYGSGLTGTLTPTTFKSAWQCRAGAALGDGATAVAAFDTTSRILTVSVSWGDSRWTDPSALTAFQATTRL